MKQLIKALIVSMSLSLLVTGNALAETQIAVMNYQAVLFNSLAADDAANQLREALSPAQGKINELKSGIQTRQNRLKTEEGILTDAETLQFKQEINQYSAELAQITNQIQSAQQQSRNEYIKFYQPVIKQFVDQQAQADGYDLVVDSQAVLYVADVPDITESVLAKFNEDFTSKKAKPVAP